MPKKRPLTPLLLLAVVALAMGCGRAAAGAANEPSKAVEHESADESEKASPTADESLFVDPDDGWLDISKFLATWVGFMAAPVIMTEPTLGYGGGASLLFIDPRKEHGDVGFKRPNITVLGGVGTENGTWAAFAGDFRHWRAGSIKTAVGAVVGRIRLDFYGLGHDRLLGGDSLEYQLKVLGLRLGSRYRLAKTDWWLGANYQFFVVDASFGQALDLPQFLHLDLKPQRSRLSGPGFSVVYDSRDSIFTPDRGLYSETSLSTGWEALGGTADYQEIDHVTLGYLPLVSTLTLGLRVDLKRSFGDTPFYSEPSISMRGVPAQRYQGKAVAQSEAEIRWQFWRRFSVLFFGGGGGAWADGGRLRRSRSVYAGGIGFRYELARKFGLHYGLDLAYGPDGGTFYFQVGSAWMRP